MMGKQSEQIQMVILDIDSMIPDTHLLRRIKNCVNLILYTKRQLPIILLLAENRLIPLF